MILEVIACSVEDAIEAEAGGAGRIEFVRDLARGGLTPDLSLVRNVVSAVSIPVRVMVRETESHTVRDPAVRRRLCAAARAFGELPLDGLVLGFLTGGRVDLELAAEVLARAPRLKATFHKAFEEAADPLLAIQDLKSLPQVDRILTAGDDAQLREWARAARPEIEILVGGGVNADTLSRLASIPELHEFHAGRAAREPAETSGRVSRAKVRELRKQLAA